MTSNFISIETTKKLYIYFQVEGLDFIGLLTLHGKATLF